MRARLPILLLLLCLFVPLAGCSKPSAVRVLEAGCGEVPSLPSGKLYALHGEDGAAVLSEELMKALFGTGSLPPEAELWEDAAVFLSYAEPFEIGVFLCRSANDTEDVAKLCLRRLAVLSAARSADAGSVTVHGRWVFLCFSEENDAVLNALRRAL